MWWTAAAPRRCTSWRPSRRSCSSSPALASKPRVVVFNKMDLPEAQAHWPHFREAAQPAQGAGDGAVLCMSAATGEGVWEVVAAAAKLLEGTREEGSPGRGDGEASALAAHPLLSYRASQAHHLRACCSAEAASLRCEGARESWLAGLWRLQSGE